VRAAPGRQADCKRQSQRDRVFEQSVHAAASAAPARLNRAGPAKSWECASGSTADASMSTCRASNQVSRHS
jgi:hypothetical protein